MNFSFLFRNLSDMRRRYTLRLVGRVLILLAACGFWLFAPEQFDVLQGANFFRRFSWLHLLWGVWVIDMAAQLFPLKAHISLGSQKLWQMKKDMLEELK